MFAFARCSHPIPPIVRSADSKPPPSVHKFALTNSTSAHLTHGILHGSGESWHLKLCCLASVTLVRVDEVIQPPAFRDTHVGGSPTQTMKMMQWSPSNMHRPCTRIVWSLNAQLHDLIMHPVTLIPRNHQQKFRDDTISATNSHCTTLI
jgi:hypothetical protein